jgi:hypothetical protein
MSLVRIATKRAVGSWRWCLHPPALREPGPLADALEDTDR